MKITLIEISPSGQLIVRPETQLEIFEFVYRAGAEVHWDKAMQAFTTPEPREWTYADWFRHMLAAVSGELGIELQITSATKWKHIADDLKCQITSVCPSL